MLDLKFNKKLAGLIFIASVVGISLTGCVPHYKASAPNYTISGVEVSKAKLDMKLMLVNCELAENAETGRYARSTTVLLQEALTSALIKKAIFKNSDNLTKIMINVEISKITGFPWNFVADYSLLNPKTGKIIYSTNVSTYVNSPKEDFFNPIGDYQGAMNEAARKNIREFISRLESAAPTINESLKN